MFMSLSMCVDTSTIVKGTPHVHVSIVSITKATRCDLANPFWSPANSSPTVALYSWAPKKNSCPNSWQNCWRWKWLCPILQFPEQNPISVIITSFLNFIDRLFNFFKLKQNLDEMEYFRKNIISHISGDENKNKNKNKIK